MEGLASGEEMERALLELGPLLGVAVKEEAPEETSDAAPTQMESGANGATPTTEPNKAAENADSAGSPRTAASTARCVLCRGDLATLTGTPRLMDCLHSACEPCIRARQDVRHDKDFLGAERVMVTCPECQLPCNPQSMIEQRFIMEKMSQDHTNNTSNSEQMCSSCEEPEAATSYCVDCNEYICDRCVSAHQRLKITKDHIIRPKEHAKEQSNTQPGVMCALHPGERLVLYCETCERLTCRDCQLGQHRDHRHQYATEMAAAARQHVSALLGEVAYKRVLLQSAMQVIRERQQLIADKKRALVHDITQAVVKLTNAISTRGKQLVLRLGEVCDAKQRTLSEKKEALERLAGVTDHCVEFVTTAMEGSDSALLYSKRVVTSHLQRVKARRADIPNPEIPVRIQLQLDKLADLIRVVSTMGAIVVDGKVDGAGSGAGSGAQGPYHPPHHTPLSAHTPHSAVMALQHAAMQQGMSGNAAAVMLQSASRQQAGGVRHNLPTPLRHPHVTSTTHPHHIQGMNDMNLRGLLSPAAAAAAAGVGGSRGRPAQYAAMQHAYQQMMNVYASNAFSPSGGGGGAGGGGGGTSGRRSVGQRTPSPAPPPPPAAVQYSALYHHANAISGVALGTQQHHATSNATAAAAKWHIPQQSVAHNGGFESHSGVDFKITLGRSPAAASVTSTNPEPPGTPTASGGPGGSTGAGGADLDRLCADSVQDLMATIAKLDSNGVQVVCEAPASASPLPAVHSSTAASPAPLTGPAPTVAAPPTGPPDPNEDWCAVCMDGGQLMCCDKCPKVFHQYCHIPTIDKLPDETETWQCLLCVNFAELPPETGAAGAGGLSARQRKVVERVTLELYCQYEPSLPFRERVSHDNVDYYTKISHPMCLDMIREKLQNPAGYCSVAEFVADVRLMFRNAYTYNPVDSQIYKDAQRLEEFFESALVKWAPEHASSVSNALAWATPASHGHGHGVGHYDMGMSKRPRLS